MLHRFALRILFALSLAIAATGCETPATKVERRKITIWERGALVKTFVSRGDVEFTELFLADDKVISIVFFREECCGRTVAFEIGGDLKRGVGSTHLDLVKCK